MIDRWEMKEREVSKYVRFFIEYLGRWAFVH